jgi:hypothetical protein
MAKTKCGECGKERVRCDYDQQRWSPCKEDAVGQVDGRDYCQKHIGKMCCICGDKATHGCESGLGGLACGMPLCDNSECSRKHIDSGHSGMSQVARDITHSISGNDFYVES